MLGRSVCTQCVYAQYLSPYNEDVPVLRYKVVQVKRPYLKSYHCVCCILVFGLLQ